MKDINAWLLLLAIFWLLRKYADALVYHTFAHREDAAGKAQHLASEEKSAETPSA